MRWRMTACCPRPWSSSFNRDEPVVPRWLIPAAVTAANVERPNPNVLRGMGLMHLSKNAKVIQELTEKGMAPG